MIRNLSELRPATAGQRQPGAADPNARATHAIPSEQVSPMPAERAGWLAREAGPVLA